MVRTTTDGGNDFGPNEYDDDFPQIDREGHFEIFAVPGTPEGTRFRMIDRKGGEWVVEVDEYAGYDGGDPMADGFVVHGKAEVSPAVGTDAPWVHIFAKPGVEPHFCHTGRDGDDAVAIEEVIRVDE